MTLTTEDLAQIDQRIAQYQSMNRVVDLFCSNTQTLAMIRREIDGNGSNDMMDKAKELAEMTDRKCREILYPN